MELADLMLSDAADTNIEVSTNDVRDISALAMAQLEWQKHIQQMEEKLLSAKEKLRNIQEYLLPEAMAQAGVKSFKLISGSKIEIKDDVAASIKANKSEAALEWFECHGYSGIIKPKVEVKFGKGDRDKAAALLEVCKNCGYDAVENLSVHPQTLKATIKEGLSKGNEFPEDIFNIHQYKKAIIK
jgi:hypothetical protein